MLASFSRLTLVLLIAIFARSASVRADGPADQRHFLFSYAGVIDQLPPGKKVRIWLPVAQDSPHQSVTRRVEQPKEYRETVEMRYGNRTLFFESVADQNGEIPFSVEYDVVRLELNEQNRQPVTRQDARLHSVASRLVPRDPKLARQILGDARFDEVPPTELAHRIFNRVDQRMRYDKPAGKPWGRGDAVWACSSGFGNCSDFHSLFIAVCLAQNIPARFEIGFPIPTDATEGSVGGYHCWAMFAANDRWIPVDISEADKHPELRDFYFGQLAANRVTFSSGRDLQLTPPQQSGPVNFLVYPHVEVDGQHHTQFRPNFRFRDLTDDE